jgi:AcrR family transcriptional regulator
MSSNLSSGKRKDGAVTAKRVMVYALEELQLVGATRFRLDQVIKKSGVSRSSVYHLFGSRAGLIARTEAQVALVDISDGVKLFYEIALKIESRDQLRAVVTAWINDASSPERIRQRAHRMASLVASATNPDLRAIMNAHFREVIQTGVETYEVLRSRGLVTLPAVDLQGLAIVVQGMYLGGVLIDGMDDDDLAQYWRDALVATLNRLFGFDIAATSN